MPKRHLPDITAYRVACSVSAPIRAAVVADFHNDSRLDLLSAIDSLSPDLVLIAGDMMDDTEKGGVNALRFLREVAEKYPTYYGLGNHERHFQEEDLAKVRACGVHLLICTSERFGELSIGAVTGMLRDYQENEAFIEAFCREDGCKLLLCHRPEWYAKHHHLKEWREIDLIVSGHAHGGQMRPLGIALYAPGQGIFPKYTSGVHDGRLIISRGLSNHVRLPRFWNPPELVCLELVPRTENTP